MKKNKVYNLGAEERRAVQMTEVEMLEEVDRICRKCGIRYTMVGGTMLGAVRHGGYIPWDDDADIGFLRTEYEKFRRACRTELDTERFYFQDCRDTDGYRWGYGKLRRKGTRFVRLGQEHMGYEQGVFIDLFPLDNVPDRKVLRRLHAAGCFLLRKFMWSEAGYRSGGNILLKMLYAAMRLVPEGVLVRWYEGMAAVCAGRRTELVRILTFPTPEGTYGYYRKWYTVLRRYEFENIRLAGAADYDGYLRYKYGDYMRIPPQGERKTHPVSELELPGKEAADEESNMGDGPVCR